MTYSVFGGTLNLAQFESLAILPIVFFSCDHQLLKPFKLCQHHHHHHHQYF